MGLPETDRLGGKEPYGASKACTEMVVESYRPTSATASGLLASARAGNVIGGGDWAEDRHPGRGACVFVWRSLYPQSSSVRPCACSTAVRLSVFRRGVSDGRTPEQLLVATWPVVDDAAGPRDRRRDHCTLGGGWRELGA